MAHDVLLTDDEIVALATISGKPWPIGLATIGGTASSLKAGALRGLRSLGIRGLISRDANSPDTVLVQPELKDAISAFVSGAIFGGAYIAPTDSPEQLVGPSITAVYAEHGWWLDAATPDGVHGIRSSSRNAAVKAIADFVEKVHGLSTGESALSAFVCVISTGAAGENVIVSPSAGSDSSWDRADVYRQFAMA